MKTKGKKRKNYKEQGCNRHRKRRGKLPHGKRSWIDSTTEFGDSNGKSRLS
jgi:hypothetical protein